MKLKELAEKLGKEIKEVKQVLEQKGIEFKNINSVIDDAGVKEVTDFFQPPVKQKRVIKVIKKKDIDSLATGEGEEDEDSISKKAFKVLENRKKEAEEKNKDEIEQTVASDDEEIAEQQPEETDKEETGATEKDEQAEKKKAETGIVDVTDLTGTTKPGEVKRHGTRVFDKNDRTFVKERSVLDVFKPKQKKRKSKYKKLKQRKLLEERSMLEQEILDNPLSELVLNQESYELGDLARLMHLKITDVIGALLKQGIMITINYKVDIALAEKIGSLFNIEVKTDFSAKEDSKIKYDLHILESSEKEDDETNTKERPPIVTIMGHVDHGKTRLLDTIRSSRLIEGESGGITQHIGAYQVTVSGKKITFLDTPGHEAFTALRARGSQVTDIVILVVAADDGIMMQTKEAIGHARAAQVPIIVAVNKIDLPDANPDRVKQQLADYDLLPEDWGGKTICCDISAREKIGIDHLLDMVLLVAETEELKANPDKKAQGIVIESQLSKQKGPVATVLIKAGTLKKGDSFVIGSVYGRVRAMFNDLGKEVETAPPSYPVEILGLTDVPRAGEILQVVNSEKEAREMAGQKAIAEKDQLLLKKRTTLASLAQIVQNGVEAKDLNIVLKADVQGSLEALTSSIQKMNTEKVAVNIIHTGTGIVNESDIMLAKASEAVVLSFSVGVQPEAAVVAEKEGVEIREYDIIYKLLEDLEKAMLGLLEPEYEEVEIGKADVRAVFKYSKVGAIAGGFVIEGVLKRNCKVKVMRDNKIIFEGTMNTLKRFKDDVKEVQTNYECGFTVERFNDFQEGDQVLAFEKREKLRG